MWHGPEPETLDDATCAHLRVLEELESMARSGRPLPFPGMYLNFGVERLVRPLKPQVTNILALPHTEARQGLVMVPMLTPGPRKTSIILAQRDCSIKFVLERLEQWDVPSFAFVVQGAMHCDSVVEYKGFKFNHRQQFSASHLTVLPPEDRRELILHRGSILLLATPGRAQSGEDHVIGVDLTSYLGHMQLESAERDMCVKDAEGNSVSFVQHNAPSLLEAPGGVITFAVHENEEPPDLYRIPDIFLIPPRLREPDAATRWSMSVMFV